MDDSMKLPDYCVPNGWVGMKPSRKFWIGIISKFTIRPFKRIWKRTKQETRGKCGWKLPLVHQHRQPRHNLCLDIVSRKNVEKRPRTPPILLVVVAVEEVFHHQVLHTRRLHCLNLRKKNKSGRSKMDHHHAASSENEPSQHHTIPSCAYTTTTTITHHVKTQRNSIYIISSSSSPKGRSLRFWSGRGHHRGDTGGKSGGRNKKRKKKT
mmetsp:Transcript_45363/g.67356  ORF Transcript_45363/g.67356 Transcript_45363/m.67356 type:complete len:209 (+) Transcript_45363:218-844(+)